MGWPCDPGKPITMSLASGHCDWSKQSQSETFPRSLYCDPTGKTTLGCRTEPCDCNGLKLRATAPCFVCVCGGGGVVLEAPRSRPVDSPRAWEFRSFLLCLNKTSVKSRLSLAPNCSGSHLAQSESRSLANGPWPHPIWSPSGSLWIPSLLTRSA